MTSQDHIPAFIARQKYLLQEERQADIERSSLVLSSCGPKLLELRGLALLGLGVASIAIGLGGKSLIELERPSAYHTTPQFPPHTFRPGDIAKIEENTSSTSKSATSKKSKKVEGSESAGTKGVEGVVYKVNDTKIIIAVDNESGDIDLPERCRLLKLANSVTFDRMDRAIEQLERILLGTSSSESADKSDNKSTKAPTPLTQVLMGLMPPSERVSAVTEGLKFLDESLNKSQKEAVRHALESPEVALIHGPPGTGKTHTLVEVIRQLVAQDKRVLVCGASNLAVDNLLERLVPHGIPLTRIGHPARVLGALHTSTLEHQASKSDESQLAKDVKEEIEELMGTLTGKGKGKSGKLKGAERRKLWDDVKELRKEYRKREGVVVKSVMSKAKIVLATCHGAGSRQLFNLEFDVVIIDEATQAVEAVCWIPILKSKKLILAGDPMQLPPTVISTGSERKKKAIAASSTKNVSNTSSKTGKSATKGQAAPEPIEDESEGEGSEEMDEVLEDEEDEDEGASTTSAPSKTSTKKAKTKFKMGTLKPSKSLEVTLFDRLEKMYGRKIIKMLTVQYRMHELICSFPSSVLYKKKLKSHPSVKKHLLRDLPSISQAESDIDVVGLPVVFFDTAGCEYFERVDGEGGSADEGSRSNENEALVVKQWVEKLVEAGVQPSQIALITPYQAQVSLLTSMMKHTMPDLEIGTVDGMQGREKDAVILSLVRSNDKREVGFLKEKRRLNVAMTRPRRHLCVVGDSATVSSGSPYLKQWMGWLEENADVRFGGLD